MSDNKGINLPDRSIDPPILSAKDKADLAFGLEHGVDWIALSFVRHADDVREAIKRLGGAKPLNICLQQEVDRLQKVLSVVRASLSNLSLAIAGTIALSEPSP